MGKTFVLDWDGTFTDNNVRARKTLEQMITLISKKYEIEETEVTTRIKKNKQGILENERKYTWTHRGHIAAYCEDPLILNNMAIVELIRELRQGNNLSEYWSETLRFLGNVYSGIQASYVQNSAETLVRLLAIGNVVIVTNSSPEKVSSEVRNQLDYSEDQVLPKNFQLNGYAKKYKIDPTLSEVRESSLTKDGRIINLRRRWYYNVLSQFDSASTYVVGDGYSCDLALPRELGFHVCLINDFELMDWARQEIDSYDKGSNIQLISDFLDVVR